MAGYTRQSAADIVATSVVRANPLNLEFDQVLAAFNASTGHKHDGTTAEGAYVPLIADSDALNKVSVDTSNNRVGVFVEVSAAAVEQVRFQDGLITPVTDNDIDLGTSSVEFKDLYLDGTATIDTLQVDENATITGNLTVNGNATLGDAATDTVTFTADIASALLPSADDTYDLGATGSEWRNLYIDGTANIDSLVADTADINGGTIDNTVIGGTTAAAADFTTMDASGNATVGGTFAVTGATTLSSTLDVTGAAGIDGDFDINTNKFTVASASGNTAVAGTLGVTGATTLSSTLGVTGNTTVGGTLGVTGESTLASATVSDLTSGRVVLAGTSGALEDSGNLTFDGSTLTVTGAATVSTNLSVNGNTTLGDAATDTVTITADVASNIIPSADSTYSLGDSSNYWSHGYIDAVTTTGNVIIGGDLTVNGTTTTISTTNTVVADLLMELGNGTTGTPSNDAGIVIERGSSDNAFIGWDESADKFTVGTGSFTGASTGDLTITTGTLVANIEGNVTGDLTGNADTATALATARTIAGQSFDGTANISIAPTDLTDVTATATEINIMDGDTSATSTTLADADRVVVNDAGTMKQVALTDFETYFEGALDTLSNVTTVGALNSGSITSGFGSINNGSSAITTTGTITFGTLSDGSDSVTDIVTSVGTGSTNSELATAAAIESRIQAVNGTANNVTGLNATGAELNAVADVSAITIDTSTAIANNDGIAVFDSSASSIGYFDVDLLDTYFSGTTKTLTNKTLTSPTVSGLQLSDSGFSVEGSSADANETTVSFTNPTADRTITFPNATGNVAVFATAPTTAITDGTSGQVLQTNGSGVLSFVDMASGADLYAANESSPTAQPSATGTNAIAIGDSAVAAANDSIAIGNGADVASFANFGVAIGQNADSNGSNSFAIGQGATADGSNSVALGRSYGGGSDSFAAAIGNASTSLGARAANSVAIGPSADCNRSNSIALGYQATVASGGGTGTVAIGQSYASGADSFAAVIADNSSSYGATGANSIAMGYQAKAFNTYAVAIGRSAIAGGDTALALGEAKSNGTRSIAIGTTTSSGKGATSTYAIAIGYNSASTGIGSVTLGPENTSSSQYSVAIGRSNTASGNYAAVIGSRDSTASADNSFASGQEAKATIKGQKVHASGQFAAKGDAQGSIFILRADTTDATATVLTTNNSTASTDNQIVAASDTCIMFSGTVVAMQNGAQDQGGWEIKGLLKNDGGTTTLVSSNIQTFDDGNGWTVALSADNTNNALAITCTGEASHNIRWVANIQTSEVTYA